LSLTIASEGFSFNNLPNEVKGLQEMLEPLLEKIPGTCRYLFEAGYLRSALQTMMDDKGVMCSPLSPSLAALYVGNCDAIIQLVEVGNIAKEALDNKALGANSSDPLVLLLKAIVDELVAAEGPSSEWPEKPWFKRLLFAAENQGPGYQGSDLATLEDVEAMKGGTTAKGFLSALKKGPLSDVEILAWALVLLRNILCHARGSSGIDRKISFVSMTPFAQPPTAVFDRFKSVLATAAKKYVEGTSSNLSSAASQDSTSAVSAFSGLQPYPRPVMLKRQLLGTPSAPHVRPQPMKPPRILRAITIRSGIHERMLTSTSRNVKGTLKRF
jgi:hypothetical protein